MFAPKGAFFDPMGGEALATIKTAIALYDGVTSPLKAMHKAMGIVLNSFETMQSASKNAIDVTSIRSAREEWSRAGAAFDEIEEKIQSAGVRQKQFNQTIQSGTNAADGLWKKLKGAAAALGGGAIAQKLAGLSDRMTNTRSRLSFLVDDGGSVSDLEQQIMASANRSRANYLDTASSIASLGANAGAAFSGNDEIIAFLEQVNKQFVIGGATAEGQSAAMLQLTQAMAAGALRGEELNSILENAPGIARAIESYMGVAEGSIKSYAEQGLVTSETVKNALFAAAEETNAKFESMPKTWDQIWTRMKNEALSIFDPILTRINQVANSERFDQVMNGLITGLGMAAAAAGGLFDLLIGGAGWVMDHWSMIAPIIGTVATDFLLLKGAVIGYNIVQGISNTLSALGVVGSSAKTAAMAAETTATITATAAQTGFNTALLACPITWIILLILALIAAFILLWENCEWFRDLWTDLWRKNMDVLLWAYNNVVVPVGNAFISAQNTVASGVSDFVSWCINAYYDLATGISSSISDVLHSMSGLIEMYNRVASAMGGRTIEINVMDRFTEGLETQRNALLQSVSWYRDRYSNQKLMKKIDEEQFGAAADEMAEKMRNFTISGWLSDQFSSLSENDFPPVPDPEEQNQDGNPWQELLDHAGDTAQNTAAIRDTLDITEEELEYMRDIAEREAINRFTTAEIKVVQRNTNYLDSTSDLDGILDTWANGFAEKLEVSGEGVYA